MLTPDETRLFCDALDLVLLECLPDDSLTVLGALPDWLMQLCAGDQPSFSFFENFLPDAKDFWEARAAGCIKSGLCTLTDGDGTPWHFEISALTVGERRLLIVQSLNLEYNEKQDLYQRARETNLIYEQLQRTEAQLREAKAVAEAATQAKSQFLANMSHEIRTPMNAVIALSTLLQRSELSRQQREFASMIASSAESLLTVINDILDFSKIEAGKLDLEMRPFDLWQTIEEAATLLGPVAAHKHVELACKIDASVPQEMQGDAVRLRQIMLNLLGNAIKFTERGEVELSVSASGAEIHFAVRDTGIGLTPEQQARLFASFAQADASTTRRFGGSGLGLAISKSLAEKMGGRMWVESEPGVGSVFQFTIPAIWTVAEPSPYRRTGHPNLLGKTIQLTGGGALNRAYAGGWATAWGMHVIESGDADFEVAIARMRAADGEAAPAGLVLYEPVRVSALYAALTDQGAKSSVATQVEVKPLRILLADDNEVNQKVGVWMLDACGYRADVVSNGVEVLAKLREHRYDVVLMDVQMPEMDGWEATREIHRLWPASERPRVIALTASALEGDREKCLAAGMDGFLSKPIREDALRAVLDAIQPAVPAPVAQAAPSTALHISDAFDPAVIAGLRALQRPGRPDLLKELLTIYRGGLPEQQASIRRAAESGDAKGLSAAAHKLRGSSGTVGAKRVAELCARLEHMGDSGATAEAVPMLVELDAAIAQLRE